MMNIFLTFDYELFFGKNSGTQENCIIKPTEAILGLLEKHQIHGTFFVDSGYLLKLDEYKRKYRTIARDSTQIKRQISQLTQQGHDIQLHVHPHWEDSFYDGNRWNIVTERYRLHDFTSNQVVDIIARYKRILTMMTDKDIFAYRAGGWCLQPFGHIKKGLKQNNIWLDSTVFANGFNHSKTHYFDFRNAPQKTMWRFEDNPLVEDRQGYFLEVPISSYKVSPYFFWRLAYTQKVQNDRFKIFGDGHGIGGSVLDKARMLTASSNSVVSLDGYKASLLVRALEMYENRQAENFVIMGHPKMMSRYSLEKLDEFLHHSQKYRFTTYSKAFAYG